MNAQHFVAKKDRIFVKVDLQKKNSHTFESGQTIHIERDWNNLNRRETQPVNAIVLSPNEYGIPVGAEVIMNHNSVHDANRVFGFQSSMEDASSRYQYYSILASEIYIYREENSEKWLPAPNFLLGLRVFEPYKGTLQGIDPKQLKNTLLITEGVLKGKVVKTVKHADYEMVFQGTSNREERLIRCRHFPNEINEREEIQFIDNYLTKQVKKGELLVGLSTLDCTAWNTKN